MFGSAAIGTWFYSLNNPFTSPNGNAMVVADAASGSSGARISFSNSNSTAGALQQNITIPKKGVYNLSLMCKGAAVSTSMSIWITDPASSNKSQTVSCGTSWTLINISFDLTSGTWTSGTGTIRFFQNAGSSRTTTVDDIFLYTF